MVLAWVLDQFSLDGILMDVIAVVLVILSIANSVIGESALPDFSRATDHRSQGVGVVNEVRSGRGKES